MRSTMRCSSVRRGSDIVDDYLPLTKRRSVMPTELHEAWPDFASLAPPDTTPPDTTPPPDTTSPVTLSARVSDRASDVRLLALLEEMRVDQSRKLTLFTVIAGVMLFSVMNQIDALKREVRFHMEASRSRSF